MSLFKTSAFGCFAVAAVLATGGDAHAQPGATPGRPTVSPYLNLLRQGGSTPGLNYYGLVRPEINDRQALQAVQSATSANQKTIGDLLNGNGLPTTGVASQFLNHRSYFLNQGGGGSGGFGPGRTSFGTGGTGSSGAARR